VIFNLLSLLLSSIGCFLSLWIVIPAPTYFWLTFSVGAPEVSLWLASWNAIALLPLLLGKQNWVFYLALALGIVGLVLSLSPLGQLPATQRNATAALQRMIGQRDFATITTKQQFRSQPFVWLDAFRGISIPAVRRTSGVVFAKPDGVPLKMEVYRPVAVGRYPGIVVIYGGAWQRGSPTDNGDFNRYLAAQGYVVWAIDYRHAPNYRFPAQLEDVNAALQFIQQQAEAYETDPQRIALMGRSSGAHLAMLAAYQANTPTIRAVINFYGPVDLAKAYADPPKPDPINTRVVLETLLGGTRAQLPDLYRLASPITYVTKPLPPTLLFYGKRDHIVEAKYGKQLHDRLQTTDTQSIYIEIPWADHVFDAVFNGISNQLALYYTERFLAWTLQASSEKS
jgi:acetyl esterase/lipase